MSDRLDDALAALRSAPVPSLATAELVRRRGEQRRRRARVVGAAAAMACVAVFAMAAAAVVGQRSGGALDYAPQPGRTEPAQPTTPAPCEPTHECSAGVPDPRIAAHLLVQPADAQRISGGTWSSSVRYDEPSPRLRVCPDGTPAGEAGTTGILRRAGGGDPVVSQVVRWDGGSGADVLAALRADVVRCPSRQMDSGAVVEHELLRPPKPYAVAVRSSSRDCPTCPPVLRLWVAVEFEEHVSYTELLPSESDSLAAWTAAAHDRVACAGVNGCPNETPLDQLGAEEGPLEPGDPVRLDGIGPIVVGMTLEEAQAAAGQPFTAFVDDLENGCGFVSPRSKRPDVSFMIVNGKVIRVDVAAGAVRTDRALGVGSTEEQVHAAYGIRVEVLPHDYVRGHYLRVTSADGRYVLVFETDGAEVTSYRAGTTDAAKFNEGCA